MFHENRNVVTKLKVENGHFAKLFEKRTIPRRLCLEVVYKKNKELSSLYNELSPLKKMMKSQNVVDVIKFLLSKKNKASKSIYYSLKSIGSVYSWYASKNIASILDNHCDIILVGDSLGSVLYNYKTTRNVTLNIMIEHSKSVKLGVQKSLMIVDMPYNTYRTSKQALKNAKLIIKKTKCDGVKLEGGNKIVKIIKNLIKNRIPVMGHLGILPQSEKGKFRSKGKKIAERNSYIKISIPESQDGELSEGSEGWIRIQDICKER